MTQQHKTDFEASKEKNQASIVLVLGQVPNREGSLTISQFYSLREESYVLFFKGMT
jgi:hypothetical protein